MRPMISLVAATLTAVLCAGCPLVEIDADVRVACSTRHDLAVEAAPTGELIEVALEIALALDDLEALRALDLDLRFAHVRLRPTSRIDDLDFVDTAQVTVASADPDSTLPTLTVVDCDGDCPRDGLDLLFPADLDANAMDYVSAGPLIVGATIGGVLPTVAWTMDVEVCAHGTATVSF